MIPRKAAKRYGPGGQYYRKRIKTPEGKYEDVYAKHRRSLPKRQGIEARMPDNTPLRKIKRARCGH